MNSNELGFNRAKYLPMHRFHMLGLVALIAACTPVMPGPDVISSTQAPGQTAPVTSASIAAPTASATASPTPQNIPDLTGETITLPAFCDESSLLASSNAARIQALEDSVAAINASGGIFGAQLDLRVVDTGGSNEEAQRALARIVRELGEGPLMLICDPQSETALLEMLNEDEIPALGPADFAERRGYLFGVDATPQQHLGYFIDDLMSHWRDRKPEGAVNEIRLALISWPAEFSGPLTNEDFLADLSDLGVQVVFQAELPTEVNANVFDLIYQMRDTNANVVYTNMRGFGLASLLNALWDLGLRQRFVVGTPAGTYDAQLFEYLAEPANAEGLFLTSTWAWWSESGHPSILAATELGGGEDLSDWGYIEMAGMVSLAERALEDAILDSGFESLSPELVTNALTALEEYPVLSGLFTVNYSGGNRSLDVLRMWIAGAEQGELMLAQ